MEAATYKGQCHCGAVRYEVTTDLSGLGDCNCSRCRRLGWVMKFAPATDFTLLSGEDKLKPYRFSTNTIEHLFCTECGIESFARAKHDGKDMVVVNVNCLEGVPDIDRATITHWDGRNF